MTKEKLVDYVMTTPNNPNLAVLNSLIDKHDKDILDKAGDNVLGPDGKLLNSVLPEGYPSSKIEDNVFLPEITVFFDFFEDEDMGAWFGNTFVKSNIVEGLTYIVNFDGVTYECVSKRKDNIAYIGNAGVYGMEPNTGEPFLFTTDSPEGFWTTNVEGSEHTISVIEKTKVITPLASEFLPHSMPLFVSLLKRGDNYYCSVPFLDIFSAIENGRTVVAIYTYIDGDGEATVSVVNRMQTRISTYDGTPRNVYFGIDIHGQDYFELDLNSDNILGIAQPE